MTNKKLIRTFNFQKNDSMKNSPTAVETGRAIVINMCDNLAVIDVDINHDYDETKNDSYWTVPQSLRIVEPEAVLHINVE